MKGILVTIKVSFDTGPLDKTELNRVTALAEEALKKGEILGIMRIPEGMIRGIMDGTNPRFTFFCRKTAWRPLCSRN